MDNKDITNARKLTKIDLTKYYFGQRRLLTARPIQAPFRYAANQSSISPNWTNPHPNRKISIGENEALKLASRVIPIPVKLRYYAPCLRWYVLRLSDKCFPATRHVEPVLINDSQTGKGLVALWQTPGLKRCAHGYLIGWRQHRIFIKTLARRDGVERLQQFLQVHLRKTSLPTTPRSFVKLICQWYGRLWMGIDAREPVLGKYKDELTVDCHGQPSHHAHRF